MVRVLPPAGDRGRAGGGAGHLRCQRGALVGAADHDRPRRRGAGARAVLRALPGAAGGSGPAASAGSARPEPRAARSGRAEGKGHATYSGDPALQPGEPVRCRLGSGGVDSGRRASPPGRSLPPLRRDLSRDRLRRAAGDQRARAAGPRRARGGDRQPVEAVQRLRPPHRCPGDPQPRGDGGGAGAGRATAGAAGRRPARGRRRAGRPASVRG
ncbi:hypothetical protein HRbin26_01862 [bacterium HR26]|nr:hypothetical protein HRbin26_01862 [bacterium HR26]